MTDQQYRITNGDGSYTQPGLTAGVCPLIYLGTDGCLTYTLEEANAEVDRLRETHGISMFVEPAVISERPEDKV